LGGEVGHPSNTLLTHNTHIQAAHADSAPIPPPHAMVENIRAGLTVQLYSLFSKLAGLLTFK